MKNLKIYIFFVVLLMSCFIFFVYTWDIPSPKRQITKNININEKVLK